MTVLLVAVGGAAGAASRYLLDRSVQGRHETGFPFGTFAVNVLATLVLGFVTGAVVGGPVPMWVATLVGTGFCGALSTWSTFAYETLRLAEERSVRAAATNVVVSVGVGLAAAVVGATLAQALTG